MTRPPALAIAAALAIVALATSATPARAEPSGPAVSSGTFPYEVTVDGVARSAVVHVPPSVAARPGRTVPMAVHLHGGLGSPESSIATTGLVEAADAERFVAFLDRLIRSLETADPSTCRPRGTSLLAVHGDADRNHSLEGGRGTRSVSGAGAHHPWPGGIATGTAVQVVPFPDWSATDALVALVARTSQ